MDQFPTLVLPRFIRVPFTEMDPWDEVRRTARASECDAQPAVSPTDDSRSLPDKSGSLR